MRKYFKLTSVFFLLMALLCVIGSTFAETVKNSSVTGQPPLGAPLFNNLGNYHRPIATKSPLAQRYFDQGMILFYGFESGEAIRSFQEATRLDQTCAMCYWGLALAIGSKMNMPMNGDEQQQAYAAIKKARTLVDPQNIVEKDYIDALFQRYSDSASIPSEKKVTEVISHGATVVTTNKAQDYANAMRKLVEKLPTDLDAKDLFALSLFDVNQWRFWSGGKEQANTAEIIKILESVLAVDPHNIAANHFYIHVIEQSPHPERALDSADFLRNAVPGAEHLLHMPSHIYILTGRYHDACLANQKAMAAFTQYQEDCRAQGFEPVINYLILHNIQFLWYSAAMEGNSTLALNSAKQLTQALPLAWLDKDNYLQLFLPVRYFAEVRFGKWNEILVERKPSSEFQYAVGIWHYARGMADVHLNKLREAEEELAQLQKIARVWPTQKSLVQYGESVLKIGEEVLAANIADRQGQDVAMIVHLKNAVKLQDDMYYTEPPAWYYPVREALGYALLKTDQAASAEAAFKQDLKQYPDNGWALFGLEKSLRAQGKNKEAAQIEQSFKKAWNWADVSLPISDIERAD
jgi:tetratricopeptide (TPR) repeat protein